MRRELKYVFQASPAHLAGALVAARVPALAVDYPPRQVTSAYFDSGIYSSFEQSNSGNSSRMKLRLRWYGDYRAAPAPILELKNRLNHLGWKHQHALKPMTLDSLTWPEIRLQMAAQIDGPDRVHIEALRFPILIATYRRQYFATTDRRMRVTVDTDLQFFDQRNRPKPNLLFDSVKTAFAIVECKLDRSDDRRVRILEPLGLRWTRFSKYCYGLAALSRLPR